MKIRKAIVVDRERLDIIEQEMPALGSQDVLVKTKAVGLCHTDLPTFLGTQGGMMTDRGYVRMISSATYPADTGHEPVGQVIEVGSEVKNFRTGQWVSGMGGGKYGAFNAGAFSDYLVLDDNERQFVTLPENMERSCEYCCAEPLECILNIIRETAARFGDNIAVVGCGFMGLMTIAGLRGCGAKHVTAIDILDGKLEVARKYGATETINSLKCEVDDAAYDITDGQFYDTVVEITGSMKGLDTAGRILRPTHRSSLKAFDGSFSGRGKVILASVYSKQEIFPISLAYNMVAKAPDLAVVMPDYVYSPRRNMEEGVRAYAKGQLPMDEFVTHRYRFDDVQKAFEALKHPDADFIKGMVLFD